MSFFPQVADEISKKALKPEFRNSEHEGVLKEIKKFSNIGNICKVKKRKEHWKESWVYCVARQEDVLFFLKKIYPHLIVKKSRVRHFIPVVANIVFANRRKRARLQKKIIACKFLRNKSLSYRAIGKKLGIDHGHARRLILFK